MPLQTGMRLGPYEILSAIGAGGMGEVYRAHDTRLDRTVAIKVLPDALAGDPQFRERFEREARAIAALTHPHICTLFDVGEAPSPGLPQSGPVHFLVMEYLEGETLGARLARGALNLGEALRVATAVADALDKAHRAGVVHRDLKPGNIMLTKSGAKLLDFGLAKTHASPSYVGRSFSASGSVSDHALPGATAMATTPPRITAQGTILGTLQYMSPEQVEGQDADARSDIFAFGAIVYEMATGRTAFVGKSPASLLGSILKEEPPPISVVRSQVTSGAGSVPLERQDAMAVSTDARMLPALERVVRRCLAKEPDDRWQTASDLLEALRWVEDARTPVGSPPTAIAARSPIRERVAWSVALLVVAFHEVDPQTKSDLWILPLDGDRKPQPFLRTPFNESDAVFSPDGRWIAYRSDETGRSATFVRPFPGPGGKWQVSTESGQDINVAAGGIPGWRADGKELFYTTGSFGQTMMAVPINLQGAFRAEPPHVLFTMQGPIAPSPRAVSRDGSRFVGVQLAQSSSSQLILTLGFLEDVKTKVK